MRRVLLTAVAAAPLLALMGGAAFAACPAAGTTTSGSDVELPSGCTVGVKSGAGVIINSNNKVTVDGGATINSTDVDNSVGVQANGGVTGSVENGGAITLQMSYVASDHNNDGVADGAFATGTNRTGILVTGGLLDGSITNDSGASILVQGNNSHGIWVQQGGSITGSVGSNGSITLTGDHGAAIALDGAVGGGLAIGGSISVAGVGTQGIETSAPIGGAVTIASTITDTGYRSTAAPTNQGILNLLTAEELQQGGSAVTIGGSVGAGIAITAATTTSTGSAVPAGGISQFGSAPALVIGAANQTTTVGNLSAAEPYGLSIGGSVTAAGVYDKATTPNLPQPASATAIVLGQSGGALNLSGGVHVTGTVSASALDAQATAINIGAGTTAGTILNDGAITAGDNASLSGQTVNAITIASGANIGSITNNGTIAATVTETASNSGHFAGAIIDSSGSVKSITNAGQIAAALIPTDSSFVLGGSSIAIDARANQTGLAISQTGSNSFQGSPAPQFTGSISGTTLTVSALATGSSNLIVGETIYGSGIAPGTVITAAGTGTGGTGTYTVGTSQTVASESLTAAGAVPSINGDILYGKGANSLDVEAGTVTGAVRETAGERNLAISVATTAGTNAALSVTAAEGHHVSSLAVGAGGVLTAKVDPTFAVGASNPTAIFDTTVHPGETGTDGAATFATGAQIGVSLSTLQIAPTATYQFVHTNGALSIGTLDTSLLKTAPYLYTTTASNDASNLFVTIALKTPAQLGLNPSGTAAFNAIFTALTKDNALGGALIAPTTKAAFLGLYNQMVPDQGIGTFESLETATQKIAALTGQTPDAGTRIPGTSLWLQEVNENIKRDNGDTLGSTDKTFGLVGGYEKAGAGGGALGVTLAYLNISDVGVATPIGGKLVSDLLELGGYYRRAWGGLRLSVRGAGGYAWFNEDRRFVTTGVSDSSKGGWNGYFGDAHAGAAYEFHLGRFYARPEFSADYLYLSEGAHKETGAGPGFDLAIAQRTSSRMSGAAIVTIGTQYGRDVWFRPEIFAGYRQVFFGNIASTTANFSGGSPFLLSPGDVNGGWLVAGFSLKGGTPLSYVALEGEADLRNNEQRYDIYLSGRAMF
jgi:hypothetical protein